MIADRLLNRFMTPANATGVTVASGPRLKAAMGVALIADILQVAIFPLFVEGAASPVDDILDLAVAGVLTWLLGWHWEFLPSFAGKLLPGVDLVPFWSLAVGNVYRKVKNVTGPDLQNLKSAHPGETH